MRASALMLLLVGGVVVAASPGNAQLPDAVPVLPEDTWEAASFIAPDGAGECEFASAEEAGEPAVARIRVGAAQETAWGVGLAWNTVAPIAALPALGGGPLPVAATFFGVPVVLVRHRTLPILESST